MRAGLRPGPHRFGLEVRKVGDPTESGPTPKDSDDRKGRQTRDCLSTGPPEGGRRRRDRNTRDRGKLSDATVSLVTCLPFRLYGGGSGVRPGPTPGRPSLLSAPDPPSRNRDFKLSRELGKRFEDKGSTVPSSDPDTPPLRLSLPFPLLFLLPSSSPSLVLSSFFSFLSSLPCFLYFRPPYLPCRVLQHRSRFTGVGEGKDLRAEGWRSFLVSTRHPDPRGPG